MLCKEILRRVVLCGDGRFPVLKEGCFGFSITRHMIASRSNRSVHPLNHNAGFNKMLSK